jgi:hypothetical protein
MAYREITSEQQWQLAEDESRLFTCDFTALLGSTDTISAVSGTSGGVTLGVTTTAGAGITVASPAVNVAAITDDRGDEIAIGKAVQVRLTEASATVGQVYEVEFWLTTTDSNRLTQVCKLQVVG